MREPLIPAVRLEFVKPPSHAAMHLPVVSLDHPAEGAQHMLPPAVRLAPKPGPDPGVRAVPRPVATLRDVRRFVMRQLSSRDRHVCVISAMTYAVGGRQVIVDLVYRDSKGRWSEKAVVRRGGTTIKLVGVKQRPLLDKTVAAAQVVPPAIVSEP